MDTTGQTMDALHLKNLLALVRAKIALATTDEMMRIAVRTVLRRWACLTTHGKTTFPLRTYKQWWRLNKSGLSITCVQQNVLDVLQQLELKYFNVEVLATYNRCPKHLRTKDPLSELLFGRCYRRRSIIQISLRPFVHCENALVSFMLCMKALKCPRDVALLIGRLIWTSRYDRTWLK